MKGGKTKISRINYLCRMWYLDWFNSEYYHLLYRHRDEKEAEFFIDNLIDRYGITKGASILDMPCGRGRHAVYLEKKGFIVTGADLAENSIRYAEAFENEHLNFIVHNMLEPFPQNNFDVVLNLFTSLGYFETEEEDLSALRNMKDCMKENGLLIIDFFNTEQVIKNVKPLETIEMDGIEFTIRKKTEGDFIYKTVQFTADEKIHHYCEKVRLLKHHDFKKLLFATGLQIINTFGDYSLGDFDENLSERLIIAAVKS